MKKNVTIGLRSKRKETIMTDYEKVIAYLRERCEEIQGEWNGDEAGNQEDRADAAAETLELINNLDKMVKELDL